MDSIFKFKTEPNQNFLFPYNVKHDLVKTKFLVHFGLILSFGSIWSVLVSTSNIYPGWDEIIVFELEKMVFDVGDDKW